MSEESGIGVRDQSLGGGEPAGAPRWGRRVLWGLLVCYWGLIFVLTHLPATDLPRVPMNDKLEHFLAYGMLGGLLYLTWWAANPRRSWLGAWVWGVGLAYGALDEWLQALVGRDCELKDWLADAAAVTIAVLVLSGVKWVVDSGRRKQKAADTSQDPLSAAMHRGPQAPEH